MALPAFILLKSIKNNKLLCYSKEDDSHQAYLQFSQDEKANNPEVQYSKFEVQKSQNIEGFVHIRSCYNHKYLVRKSADSKSIVAEANEPEEDQSKWSCTLFKAIVIEGDSDEHPIVHPDDFYPTPHKIRLVHADGLGEQACVQSSETTDLVIEDSGTTSRAPNDDIFIAYDAVSVFVLPDYVAFMAPNDKYGAPTAALSANPGPPLNIVRYLEFKTTDIGHDGVIHLLDQSPLNHPPFVMVKNTSLAVSTNFWAGFWRSRQGNRYITMDVDTSTFVELFVPIRLAGNSLALRLYDYTRLFANSIKATVPGPNLVVTMDQVLGATATSIDTSAVLRVVEPVLMREVSDVVFRDSRVYNVGQVEKFVDERSNSTSVDQTGAFRVSYKRAQSRSWNDSVSVTRTVAASWSSKIPFVGEFGVEYSDERSQTVEWGEEIIEEETVEYEQNVTIPPGKKITISVIASRAECDVTFRCRVRDTLSDGTIRAYTKTDGMFVGSNEFNFQTRLVEVDL